MEKLESILRAEDASRTAVQEARGEASRILSEARARAAELIRDGRDANRAEALVRTTAIISAARDEAETLSATASEEAGRVLQAADALTDDALEAVLQVLRER